MLNYKKILKNTVRLFVALLLMFLTICTALFFIPISSQTINQKISSIIKQSTDLNFTSDNTKLYIPQGRIILQNNTLIQAGQNSANPIKSSLIEIEFDWKSMLFSKTKIIEKVAFENIDDIKISYKKIAAKKELSINDVLDISKITKKIDLEMEGDKKYNILINNFKIYNLSADFTAFNDTITSESLTTMTHNLKLKNVNLNYEYNLKDTDEYITLNGNIGKEFLTKFSGSADISPNRQNINYKIMLRQFTNNSPFDLKLPLNINGKSLSSEGKISFIEEGVDFSSKFSFRNLKVVSNKGTTLIPDSVPEFNLDGIYKAQNKTVYINKSDITLLNSKIKSNQIELQLSDNFKYKIDAEFSNLSLEIANHIKGLLELNGGFAKVPDNSIYMSFISEGELSNLPNSSINGKVKLTNISFKPESFSFPVNSLSGDILFNRKEFYFEKFKIASGKNDLIFSFKATGDLFTKTVDKMAFEWNGKVDAAELLLNVNKLTEKLPLTEVDFLGKKVPLIKFSDASGTIEVKGSAQTIVKEKNYFNDLTTSQSIILQNCNFRHPLLPISINNANGKFEIKNNQIKSNDFKCDISGINCSLEGTSEGDKNFWQAPKINATLIANGKFEDTVNEIFNSLYKNNNKFKFKKFTFKGNYNSKSNITGLLNDLNINSEININDGELFVAQPWVNLPFKNMNLQLLTQNTYIDIPKLEAVIGSTYISGKGEATLNKIGASFSIDGQLEDLKNFLPVIFYPFDLKGKVKTDKFEIAVVPKQKLEPDLAQLLQLVNEKSNFIKLNDLIKIIPYYTKNLAQFEEKFNLIYKSEAINGENLTFNHQAVPVNLSGISGKIYIDENIVRGENLKAQLASSKDCIFSAETRYTGKDRYANIGVFAPNIKLDEWINGWGNFDWTDKYKKLGVRIPPDEEINFNLTTSIAGDKISYKQLKADNIKFDLIYNNHKSNKINMIECNNLECGFYDGLLKGKLNYDFMQEPVYFKSDINSASINLKDFLWDYNPIMRNNMNTEGKTNFSIQLEGNYDNFNTYKGIGGIEIQECSLLENKLYKGLGDFLMLDIFKKNSLSTVKSDFDIKDGYIKSDNILIKSSLYDIEAKGKSDFNKTLDFDLNILFIGPMLEDSVKNIPILDNVVDVVVDKVSGITNKLLKVHLEGNLDTPKYSIKKPFTK